MEVDSIYDVLKSSDFISSIDETGVMIYSI